MKDLQDRLPAWGRDFAKQAVARITLAVHREAIKGIQKVSQGRKQTRYGPGSGRKRVVTVSKPGDPFNIDTGETHTNIRPIVDLARLEGRIEGPLVSFWLERGTKTMAARPWLRPAVRIVSTQLGDLVKFRTP